MKWSSLMKICSIKYSIIFRNIAFFDMTDAMKCMPTRIPLEK